MGVETMFHPQLRSTYVLAGPIRWVGQDGRRAVLRVDAAGGRARRFCGRSVTLELDHCPRIGAMDPTTDDGRRPAPGQVVTVKARLPRRLEDLPAVALPAVGADAGPAALSGVASTRAGLWQTNAISVRVGTTTVLVDSPVFPDELDALPRPDLLVSTHSHFDHVLAQAAFADLELQAGPSTLARLREEPEATLAQLRDSDAELYVERAAQPDLDRVVALPDGLFETVEAGGHAPDGTALFAEEHLLLLPGDYLCEVEIPLVSQAGSPEAYLATLDRITPFVRRAERVVPGHGPPLERARALELLDLDRRYVDALAGDPRAPRPLRGSPPTASAHPRRQRRQAPRAGRLT
jgi:glyoxylase-like metal-dependent hydrolase (beta-lactamase superfamily II)